MDWTTFITDLVPVVLRKSKLFKLIFGATKKTTTEEAAAKSFADMTIAETKVIGQMTPVQSYLNAKYGSGIVITDEGGDWTIPLFGVEDDIKIGLDVASCGTPDEALVITSVEDTEVWDLTVTVPTGINAEAVAADVRKRLFAGVTARIIAS